MLKSARERCNCLQRERHANQRIKSIGPFETPQERNNRLCHKRQTVQQAIACAQPSLSNDVLQLFAKSIRPSKTPQKRSNRLR
jgi:hypothetical protein